MSVHEAAAGEAEAGGSGGTQGGRHISAVRALTRAGGALDECAGGLHAAVLIVHHGPKRRTRHMAAARAGDVPRLSRLLRTASGALRGRSNVNGSASNGSASNGSTPLHWAAWKGRTAAVPVLLAAGAAVGAVTNEGWTPLHLAAQFGHTAALEALLAAGAAVGAATNRGTTLLHVAAWNGHTAALEALLAAGAVVGAAVRALVMECW